MRRRKISQSSLAKKIDGWQQSNITGILNNSKGNVRVGNLYRIFNALGCDIVVRSKIEGEEWIIDFTEEELNEINPKYKRVVDSSDTKKVSKSIHF